MVWPRISSTSVIRGTGFMKCIPRTLSGRFVAAPSSVIEIDDVFDARIACGLVIASRPENNSRFASGCSTIAPIGVRSAEFKTTRRPFSAV